MLPGFGHRQKNRGSSALARSSSVTALSILNLPAAVRRSSRDGHRFQFAADVFGERGYGACRHVPKASEPLSGSPGAILREVELVDRNVGGSRSTSCPRGRVRRACGRRSFCRVHRRHRFIAHELSDGFDQGVGVTVRWHGSVARRSPVRSPVSVIAEGDERVVLFHLYQETGRARRPPDHITARRSQRDRACVADLSRLVSAGAATTSWEVIPRLIDDKYAVHF